MMKEKSGKMLLILGGLGILLLMTAFAPAALPPRPEATPVPPTPTPAAAGAQIELAVSGGQGNEWTKVQWLDAAANQWRNVDGWGGSVDGNGRVLWWVGEENLGRGPFRWQVFDEEGGDLLATSGRFFLPGRAGDLLEVTVSLAP